jgi:hypothetical protein
MHQNLLHTDVRVKGLCFISHASFSCIERSLNESFDYIETSVKVRFLLDYSENLINCRKIFMLPDSRWSLFCIFFDTEDEGDIFLRNVVEVQLITPRYVPPRR